MTFKNAAKLAGVSHRSGKQAIRNQYREQIVAPKELSIVGSADIDGHFRQSESNANRWDYVVGFKNRKHFVIWIEPHPASGKKEVQTVLRKLSWLKSKLKTKSFLGFRDLTEIAKEFGYNPYRWIYKGKSSYRVGGNEAKLLAKEGMRLPERILIVK